jgi:hypothetical protein
MSANLFLTFWDKSFKLTVEENASTNKKRKGCEENGRKEWESIY